MEHALFSLFLLLTLHFASAQTTIDRLLPLSEQMALSDMVRNPKAWMADFNTEPKWSYCQGIMTQTALMLYQKTNKAAYLDYAREFIDEMVSKVGKIATYSLEEYNLDRIRAGVTLLWLYDLDPQPHYKTAFETLRKQLDTHPRTSDAGLWHKKIYPSQMWLDGLYMASPFYAEYTAKYGEKGDFADIVKQYILVARHTYDPNSGLYRHGWDESRQERWSDPVTGQSPHVWGRAAGWYAMAIVDVLDFIPEDEPDREKIIEILNTLASGLVKYQAKNGMWSQVLDKPLDRRNYQEATCTSMFVYALLKGVRMGYLPTKYTAIAEKGYKGLVSEFVVRDEEGLLNLTHCCGVAGLGGKPYRDGSFEYYVNEIIRNNDPKGVGPFIMASLEIERLGKKITKK